MAWPSPNPQRWARQQLEILRRDYHDFNPSLVPQLAYPTPVEFGKQVSKGRPCIYTIDVSSDSEQWPALQWSLEDLTLRVREPLEVAITPQGNADSLIPHPESPHDQLFVEPATIELTLKQLMSKLAPPCSDRLQTSAAYYLQSQNSNLTSTPLSPLLRDLPDNFDFAASVLGQPDAQNIWIGDERSVTSIHCDPYENLYLVLKGSKTFRLWAPVDEVCMPTRMVSTGRYKCSETDGRPQFDVEIAQDSTTIPWVDFDPLVVQENGSSCSARTLLEMMHLVTVKEGQILYLPAGWYHHVTQTCGAWDDGSRAPCIAVNYWYDMDYEGDRYVLRQMVSRLAELTREQPDS